MYKTFRFRLYPNDNQIILINKTFGCYRFIYNYFLNICKDNCYRCVFDMIKEIPSLKKNKEIQRKLLRQIKNNSSYRNLNLWRRKVLSL